MLSENLATLFHQYLCAFKAYDIESAFNCYYLPCTLQTPDKVLQITSKAEFDQEFISIFDQLQQADTQDIVATKASYSLLNDSIVLVSIDWAFFDKKNEIFADFCALYHIVISNNVLKIINVVSHDLSNSITLDHLLDIEQISRVESI